MTHERMEEAIWRRKPNAIPDTLDDADPVFELGGTIGRRASIECKQGQHDLCADPDCRCRHHEAEL